MWLAFCVERVTLTVVMGTVVEASVTCSVCSAFWDIYNGHSASVDICMTFKCKLVFKLPGNCNKMCYFMVILLFDIGIWQRLLDFYFVNDHFNGLCIFIEENCLVQLITLRQKTWPSMKQWLFKNYNFVGIVELLV